MRPDILAEIGHPFIGSRLKRLAERFQADAVKITAGAGFAIQPGQFPLLAAIDRFGPLTVGEAVEALGVSQPSVTRSLNGLTALGLVATTSSEADRRRKTIVLTDAGAHAIATVRTTIWPRFETAVLQMCDGLSGPFLDQVAALEAALGETPFDQRVAANDAGLRIVEYRDDLAGDFYRINAEWIEAMFVMEDNDRRILENPREAIIDRGGIILFVEAAGLGIVGACALIRIDDGCFELTKMGVLETARGRKAGEFLLAQMLDRARAMRLETLYLLTNSKCAAAVHLYEKLGFAHDAAIMQRYGSRYERCNVAMSFPL